MKFLLYPELGCDRDYQPKPKAETEVTLTEAFIILDIMKTKSNHRFIIYTLIEKKRKSCFCFFADSKQHKLCKHDMITCDFECP